MCEEKVKFARLLLSEKDAFKAALLLYPDDTSHALWVADNWANDEEVLAYVATHDSIDALPSKTQLARDIWERMQGIALSNGKISRPTADDYVKLAKLYADVRGFIEKPQMNSNVTVVVPKAIEVPTYESDAAWEKAAAKQQQELISVSRSRH